MASLNKVMIIGNLGADPELKNTPSGASYCKLSVATTDSWTDKSGAKQERTEWHRVTAWGTTAENCARFLKKGRSVFVEGSLETSSYDDKDGNKKYSTEIKARNVTFLGGKDSGSSTSPQSAELSEDDNIPF